MNAVLSSPQNSLNGSFLNIRAHPCHPRFKTTADDTDGHGFVDSKTFGYLVPGMAMPLAWRFALEEPG